MVREVRERETGADPGSAVDHRWAVILAGGDGKRLLPLTRRLFGDDRPKQFCRLLGAETLFDQTLRRVARVVSPQRTFSVVTRTHQRFYSQRSPETLLEQPSNQGTGPAVTYSLMRLCGLDPQAVVGFFPSDHHFADDLEFSSCVEQAFAFAEVHPDVVVLLGIQPTEPETGYGWVEPGEPSAATFGPGTVAAVQGFWEKPSKATATELMRRGCFWNSFVMVGRAEAFLELVRSAIPNLLRGFEAVAPALFTEEEEASVLDLYLRIPPSSFSSDVLSVCPGNLAVLCSRTLEWTDVGEVDRAVALIERKGPGVAVREKPSGQRATAQVVTATGC